MKASCPRQPTEEIANMKGKINNEIEEQILCAIYKYGSVEATAHRTNNWNFEILTKWSVSHLP